jgi:hypothetical protein
LAVPLFLHRNLGALAKLAADASTRYALPGVRVIDPGDGTYRLEVTDGRKLAVVRAGCADPRGTPPELPGCGPGALVIPSADWLEAFKMVPRRQDWLGLGLAGGRFTFAVNGASKEGAPLAGTFPSVDKVLPKRGPLVSFAVSPEYLRDVAELAVKLGLERLDVLFYRHGAPVGFLGRNDLGQYLDALLSPLS